MFYHEFTTLMFRITTVMYKGNILHKDEDKRKGFVDACQKFRTYMSKFDSNRKIHNRFNENEYNHLQQVLTSIQKPEKRINTKYTDGWEDAVLRMKSVLSDFNKRYKTAFGCDED